MNAHAAVEAENPRAVMGANNPPLSPYEANALHLDGLLMEAGNWANGDGVDSQDKADAVSRLIEDLRLGGEAADEARLTEKKPHDDIIDEIQTRWNVYIGGLRAKVKNPGKVTVAIDALKATLKPFLDKLDAEKKAAALLAQKAAQDALDAAQAAAKAAQTDNLESRDTAQDLADKARQLQKAAAYAQNDKAQAKGGSRALGLKTYYRPEMVNPKAALMHYMTAQPDAIKACLQRLAEQDVHEGKRTIPGFDVIPETRL